MKWVDMSSPQGKYHPNLNFSRKSTQGRRAPTVGKRVRSKPLCTHSDRNTTSMTQNDFVDKTDTFGATSAGRQEFLTALYKGISNDLYLELRCIHPTTGEARSLWGRRDNKSELSSALKQAETLNREGYGVYFAPCLRKRKQGKAEAAALVPALWVDIDCDEDARQRDEGLQKLRDFDPAPSFIIDSGGGWHGYWLLEEPVQLQSEADRQKIAGILRGLFAALGGDPE